MVDTFPFTAEYNDTLLKIVGEMLDPELGTAVFGFGTLTDRPDYALITRPESRLAVIQTGLNNLRERGFTAINSPQVKAGQLYTQSDSAYFPFDVYQGSDAPPIRL